MRNRFQDLQIIVIFLNKTIYLLLHKAFYFSFIRILKWDINELIFQIYVYIYQNIPRHLICKRIDNPVMTMDVSHIVCHRAIIGFIIKCCRFFSYIEFLY